MVQAMVQAMPRVRHLEAGLGAGTQQPSVSAANKVFVTNFEWRCVGSELCW